MRQVGRFILIAQALGETSAWYLPGVAPHDFANGERVELKVNKLTSTRTQVPYDYYSLPFCEPPGGVTTVAENLGEFLSGDRIDNSPYELYMRDDSLCNVLCQKVYGRTEVDAFKTAIDEGYHHNWIIDNLPAASVTSANGITETSFSKGFPVGYKTPRGPLDYNAGDGGGLMGGMNAAVDYFLYNHVELIVKYHNLGPDLNRVVGFYVEPRSVRHFFENGEHWNPGSGYMPALATCDKWARDGESPIDLAAEEQASGWDAWDDDWSNGIGLTTAAAVEAQKVEPGTVLFTYDVTWRPSDIKWSSRWDIYLSMGGAVPNKVHWFSIVNSMLIVVFLSALVLMILIRSVYGDISRYNTRADEVEPMTAEMRQMEKEESGWKLVHGNVFSPPATMPMLFCACVGTGQQLLCMAATTAVLACLGFLSPANRGSMLLALVCFFCLFSCYGGYTAGRLHRAFRGKGWEAVGALASLGFSGLAFTTFLVADGALHALDSSGAVPLPTMLGLGFFWLAVAAPLGMGGAYVGYHRDPPQGFPLQADTILRPVPEQPWFLGLVPTVVLGGILPFGACFVELFFVLSSIWMDQYYYVFGFLMLVFVILVVTCAEVTVVLVYFQLCSEDYNWWWRSFLAAGSTAIYVFLYSAIYFNKLEANLAVTYVIYFGYMSLLCLGLFLLCGFVGFTASLAFIIQIYGSIKVD